jgi:hypothetical protein
MFRKPSRWELKIERPQHECPECKQPMRNMGVYFEPPRKNDVKAWVRMELLSDNGYTFHSVGSRPFIEGFLFSSKRPSLRALRTSLEAWGKKG